MPQKQDLCSGSVPAVVCRGVPCEGISVSALAVRIGRCLRCLYARRVSLFVVVCIVRAFAESCLRRCLLRWLRRGGSGVGVGLGCRAGHVALWCGQYLLWGGTVFFEG